MLIQRCTQLMIELDSEPRFALESLLSGGDGLNGTPRWMAYAAHLDSPVQVSLTELNVLEVIGTDSIHEQAALVDEHGEQLILGLLNKGLLLNDSEQHAQWRERDQLLSLV